MDNLNTHKPASLYESFPSAEARPPIEQLEIHDTPVHGSWLEMAETEPSVLTEQRLDRRRPDAETMAREVAARETSRNAAQARIRWRFTTSQTRIPLKRLDPSFQD